MGDPSKLSVTYPCPRPDHGDFYSPFFRVKFFAALSTTRDVAVTTSELRRESRIAPNANRIANQPPVSGQEFFDPILEENAAKELQLLLDSRALHNYASDMEIEYQGSNVARLRMTLTPPYDEAKRILDDRLIHRGTVALVEFGYASRDQNDILSGPYLFVINDPSSDFGDDISITLNGDDVLASNLMRRETKRIWNRGKTSPSEEGASGGSFPTDLKIVESMALELGLTLNTEFVADNSKLREAKSNALEQTQNDWQFLQTILKDNKCSFLLCGNTLHISDRNVVVIEPFPQYRLLYRAALESSKDVPIKSVKFDTKGDLFQGRLAKNITVVASDRDNGGSRDSEIASNKTGVSSLGENSYAGDKGNEKVTTTPHGPIKAQKALAANQTGSVVSGSKEDEYLIGKAESLAEEGATNSGLTGTVNIPGVPALRPEQKVIIDGVPEYYRGEYLVTKVIHRINDSGYETEASVVRQGFIKPLTGTKQTSDYSDKTDVRSASDKPRLLSRRDG